MGSHLKGCNVSTFQSVQLVWIYFVAGRSPATSNTTVLCLCEGDGVNGTHSWVNNKGKNQLTTRNLTILTHKVEVPGSLGGYHEETKEPIRQ